MSKKLGTLVKAARTDRKLSQAALAEMVDGLSASDVSKIERGEKEPETAVLKSMAKALGVTQTSLLEAASGAGKSGAKAKSSSSGAKASSSAKSSSASGSSSKTTAAKKTASTAKTASSKTSSSAKKTSSTASDDLKLTAAEKKLVRAYRKADSATKKTALSLLEGTASPLDLAGAFLSAKTDSDGKGSGDSSMIEDLLGSLLGGLGK